jgi:trehalose 6-phosphate synthase
LPRPDVQIYTVTNKNVTYVVTDLSEEDYQEYYNGFANRVLWPILHFRLDLAEFARRDLTGYMRVNEHFATELEKIIEPDDLIWVHDYHLIPIADALRRRGHANRIGFFLHVPMPPPEVLTSLPNHEQLIPLLLQYDVVGFQTDGDSGNFVRYLIAENNDPLQEMRLFETSSHQVAFTSNRRQTRVGSFPVGIEPRGFQGLARRNVRSSKCECADSVIACRRATILPRPSISRAAVTRFPIMAGCLSNEAAQRAIRCIAVGSCAYFLQWWH